MTPGRSVERSADAKGSGVPALGIVVWVVFVAAGSALERVTLIDSILVFAPLVIVPLARPLTPAVRPLPSWVELGAATAVAIAFLLDAGVLAALLASTWLATALVALLATAAAQLRARAPDVASLVALVASVYLVVAASFVLATRARWSIAGISEPIIELTGVHFHYAGFATVVIAGAAVRASIKARPLAVAALAGVAVAAPFVAAGFTWTIEVFQVGGAVLLTVSLWTLAAVTIFAAAPRTPRAAYFLLVISSLSVPAPMVLAVFWAVSQYTYVPALSIPDMARVHGTLNAFGFVTCGLVGWRLAASSQPASQPAGAT
ncbi:MAG TPA: YndJ family transporter [Acidimicrobiia bacterium]|nr:YndJ family transporter [Acidimicrobiia bacterium]